jgi:glycosyltransferase involved in cell wall biosynthesis
LKILLLNSEYLPIGGGAGNATANLARELAAMENEVTVVTTRFGSFPHDEWQPGVNGAKFRVYRVPALRQHIDRSGALEQAVFILGAIWGTGHLLRQWKPDVIIAFFGVPSGAVALFLQFLFGGIPYIISLRGGDVPGFRPYDFALYHRLISPLLHLVWLRASAVVANSQGLRDLAQAFDHKVTIQIIPNGVDIQRFSPGMLMREWHPPKVLFVGRVVYQKGLDLLLEALGSLQSSPWQLTIAGDGSQRDLLMAQAEHLGVSERIRFLGWLDGAQLLPEYQRANLFVFPSRHEGMPNAVLEAMACGLPVVASKIAGNEELVVPASETTCGTGILVPPEDVDSLRVALQTLLNDVNLRMVMGEAARQRVEQVYTWRGVAEQYMKLCAEFAV